MKDKGHPVPRNAASEDHCLLWYLRGECKADCMRNADHIPSFTILEPLFQCCEQAYEWEDNRQPSHLLAVVPASSWRTASAVAPTVISKIYIQTKDPTSITNFPTLTNPFHFNLGKNTNICDHVLYAPLVLLPPVLLSFSLNPAVAPFPSESLLDLTADSSHPTPSASNDIPSLLATTPSASFNTPLVVASFPES